MTDSKTKLWTQIQNFVLKNEIYYSKNQIRPQKPNSGLLAPKSVDESSFHSQQPLNGGRSGLEPDPRPCARRNKIIPLALVGRVIVARIAVNRGKKNSNPRTLKTRDSHVSCTRSATNLCGNRRPGGGISKSRSDARPVESLCHHIVLALMRTLNIEISRADEDESRHGAAPECKGRPAASSGTIPTCENPVTRPGIEPSSPWREASAGRRQDCVHILTPRQEAREGTHVYTPARANFHGLDKKKDNLAIGKYHIPACCCSVRELDVRFLRLRRTNPRITKARLTRNDFPYYIASVESYFLLDMLFHWKYRCLKAIHDKWLDYSPPSKAKPGSIPGGVAPGFSHLGIVPGNAAGREGFLGVLQFPLALSFRRCSLLTSLHPHRFSRPPHFFVTSETLHALRVGAIRHLACELVSPVSLPRFLTLDAGFPRVSIPLLKANHISSLTHSVSVAPGLLGKTATQFAYPSESQGKASVQFMNRWVSSIPRTDREAPPRLLVVVG
ncbi:hypothetical protein PR048_026064 [Dryococelus australis]|uniref:Uncharacterized protein n=1 Tax=Dryococelus australis TaxID=614101 RepID=A0ABQ9GKC7_9NEOP|nr:hypothetical protein PR048_026064 [Dryococelus australis]